MVIASEPLTYERTDWIAVPPNTCVILTSRFNLLIYPIQDEYYTKYRNRMQLNCPEAAVPPHATLYSPRIPAANPLSPTNTPMTWG
jgi:hypothetical protein